MKVLPAEMVISKRQIIWGFHRWIVNDGRRWRQNGNLRHQTNTNGVEESRGIQRNLLVLVRYCGCDIRLSPVVYTVGGKHPILGFQTIQVLQDFNPNHPQYHFHRIFSGTLWLFNIAMENGPFIDGLPVKNRNFPWLC